MAKDIQYRKRHFSEIEEPKITTLLPPPDPLIEANREMEEELNYIHDPKNLEKLQMVGAYSSKFGTDKATEELIYNILNGITEKSVNPKDIMKFGVTSGKSLTPKDLVSGLKINLNGEETPLKFKEETIAKKPEISLDEAKIIKRLIHDKELYTEDFKYGKPSNHYNISSGIASGVLTVEGDKVFRIKNGKRETLPIYVIDREGNFKPAEYTEAITPELTGEMRQRPISAERFDEKAGAKSAKQRDEEANFWQQLPDPSQMMLVNPIKNIAGKGVTLGNIDQSHVGEPGGALEETKKWAELASVAGGMIPLGIATGGLGLGATGSAALFTGFQVPRILGDSPLGTNKRSTLGSFAEFGIEGASTALGMKYLFGGMGALHQTALKTGLGGFKDAAKLGAKYAGLQAGVNTGQAAASILGNVAIDKFIEGKDINFAEQLWAGLKEGIPKALGMAFVGELATPGIGGTVKAGRATTARRNLNEALINDPNLRAEISKATNYISGNTFKPTADIIEVLQKQGFAKTKPQKEILKETIETIKKFNIDLSTMIGKDDMVIALGWKEGEPELYALNTGTENYKEAVKKIDGEPFYDLDGKYYKAIQPLDNIQPWRIQEFEPKATAGEPTVAGDPTAASTPKNTDMPEEYLAVAINEFSKKGVSKAVKGLQSEDPAAVASDIAKVYTEITGKQWDDKVPVKDVFGELNQAAQGNRKLSGYLTANKENQTKVNTFLAEAEANYLFNQEMEARMGDGLSRNEAAISILEKLGKKFTNQSEDAIRKTFVKTALENSDEGLVAIFDGTNDRIRQEAEQAEIAAKAAKESTKPEVKPPAKTPVQPRAWIVKPKAKTTLPKVIMKPKAVAKPKAEVVNEPTSIKKVEQPVVKPKEPVKVATKEAPAVKTEPTRSAETVEKVAEPVAEPIKKMVDGVEYVRNTKDIARVEGAETEVSFGNRKVKGRFAVIESDVAQPSHKEGRINHGNFLDAQPKPRTDAGSQEAALDIAINPDKERIFNSGEAFQGAPIANKRGEIIQGNNRTDGIQQGYKRGEYKKYKNALLAKAQELGLDVEQINKMKNPMLVREIDVSDAMAKELGNIKDESATTGSNVAKINVEFKGLADKTANNILNATFRGDAETVNGYITKNYDNLINLMTKVPTDAGSDNILKGSVVPFKTQHGDPNPLWVARIQDWIADGLFGKTGRVQLQELSSKAYNGLLKSSGDIKQSGVLPKVQEAIGALLRFKKSGQKDFGAWTKQIDMNTLDAMQDFYDPQTLALAKKIIGANTEKEIRGLFRNIKDLTTGSKDLLSDVPAVSAEQALEKVLGVRSEVPVKMFGKKDAGNLAIDPKNVLSNLKDLQKHPDKHVRKVAKVLDSITGKLGIIPEYKETPFNDKYGVEIRGDKVTFLGDKEMSVDNYLHEVGHVALGKIIKLFQDNPRSLDAQISAAVKDLELLLKLSREKLGIKDFNMDVANPYYFLKDLQEFPSGIFDGSAERILSGVKWNQNETLFQKIKNTVLKIFGFDPKDTITARAFDQIMKIDKSLKKPLTQEEVVMAFGKKTEEANEFLAPPSRTPIMEKVRIVARSKFKKEYQDAAIRNLDKFARMLKSPIGMWNKATAHPFLLKIRNAKFKGEEIAGKFSRKGKAVQNSLSKIKATPKELVVAGQANGYIFEMASMDANLEITPKLIKEKIAEVAAHLKTNVDVEKVYEVYQKKRVIDNMKIEAESIDRLIKEHGIYNFDDAHEKLNQLYKEINKVDLKANAIKMKIAEQLELKETPATKAEIQRLGELHKELKAKTLPRERADARNLESILKFAQEAPKQHYTGRWDDASRYPYATRVTEFVKGEKGMKRVYDSKTYKTMNNAPRFDKMEVAQKFADDMIKKARLLTPKELDALGTKEQLYEIDFIDPRTGKKGEGKRYVTIKALDQSVYLENKLFTGNLKELKRLAEKLLAGKNLDSGDIAKIKAVNEEAKEYVDEGLEADTDWNSLFETTEKILDGDITKKAAKQLLIELTEPLIYRPKWARKNYNIAGWQINDINSKQVKTYFQDKYSAPLAKIEKKIVVHSVNRAIDDVQLNLVENGLNNSKFARNLIELKHRNQMIDVTSDFWKTKPGRIVEKSLNVWGGLQNLRIMGYNAPSGVKNALIAKTQGVFNDVAYGTKLTTMLKARLGLTGEGAAAVVAAIRDSVTNTLQGIDAPIHDNVWLKNRLGKDYEIFKEAIERLVNSDAMSSRAAQDVVRNRLDESAYIFTTIAEKLVRTSHGFTKVLEAMLDNPFKVSLDDPNYKKLKNAYIDELFFEAKNYIEKVDGDYSMMSRGWTTKKYGKNPFMRNLALPLQSPSIVALHNYLDIVHAALKKDNPNKWRARSVALIQPAALALLFGAAGSLIFGDIKNILDFYDKTFGNQDDLPPGARETNEEETYRWVRDFVKRIGGDSEDAKFLTTTLKQGLNTAALEELFGDYAPDLNVEMGGLQLFPIVISHAQQLAKDLVFTDYQTGEARVLSLIRAINGQFDSVFKAAFDAKNNEITDKRGVPIGKEPTISDLLFTAVFRSSAPDRRAVNAEFKHEVPLETSKQKRDALKTYVSNDGVKVQNEDEFLNKTELAVEIHDKVVETFENMRGDIKDNISRAKDFINRAEDKIVEKVTEGGKYISKTNQDMRAEQKKYLTDLRDYYAAEIYAQVLNQYTKAKNMRAEQTGYNEYGKPIGKIKNLSNIHDRARAYMFGKFYKKYKNEP